MGVRVKGSFMRKRSRSILSTQPVHGSTARVDNLMESRPLGGFEDVDRSDHVRERPLRGSSL